MPVSLAPEQVRPTLQDRFPPPPWLGPQELVRRRGELVYKAKLLAPEGAYWIRESGDVRMISRREEEGSRTFLSRFDGYGLFEVRGAIRFYSVGSWLYKGATKDMPLWPGDAYIIYDVVSGEHRPSVRIVDTVVGENIRRRGFGSTLVRLMEQRALVYGATELRGNATEMGFDFWPTQGYYFVSGRSFSKVLAA